ncbi:MAG: RHS repeat-associated core domain-containing protein [Mycobacteriales bacterium]
MGQRQSRRPTTTVHHRRLATSHRRTHLDSYDKSIVGAYNYTPYGATTSQAGATTPLQYDGAYHDPTGLYYLNARYYDPATGQFLSRDLLAALTGSPYGYVGDNPLNYGDPSGLATIGECAGVSSFLGVIKLGVGACLARTIDSNGTDQIGVTATPGGGVGLGSNLSASMYYEISNATQLSQLRGLFYFANLAVDIGAGAFVTVFWNAGKSIYGIDVGLSAGAGFDVGYGASLTKLHQFGGIEAWVAKHIWNLFDPALSVNQGLARARAGILAAAQAGCS